jgi:signal transduction histidine kinase
MSMGVSESGSLIKPGVDSVPRPRADNPRAGVTAVDRIALAPDISEVYKHSAIALAELLAPACCLIFDRDDYGQLRLAYRWNAPDRAEPDTGPLVIVDQVQSWWMVTLQAGGPPKRIRLTALPGQPRTLVAPLLTAETLHGMLVLQGVDRTLEGPSEREAIALITTMSLTLHTFALRERLATAVLPEQVEEAITQERRRIAREIHDGVAQSLAYLNLKAELFDRLVERDPAGAREQAGVVRQMLQSAMTDLRRCIGDLRRPSSGQGPAMTAQLRSLATSIGEMPNLELALQEVSGTRLAPEVERTVIGIVREALHNIRKHAEANSVQVEVQRDGEALRVLVTDDGKGFQLNQPAADQDPHFGMTQMRELAQDLGGKLSITSRPGSGTRVEALIPLTAGSRGQAADTTNGTTG